MNEFDQKAAGWDINPIHLERSVAIAGCLTEMIPLGNTMTALEYGAGTGLLALMLKDRLKEVILMDSSEGMISVIREKITKTGIENLKPILLDLEKETFEAEFDLIFNQMVFHHVNDIDLILGKFHGLLKPGGYLAIADLYPEDGSFHGDGFTGHKGFDPVKLSARLSAAGFTRISYRECYIMKKVLDDGTTREYPIFLMAAQR